MMVKKTRTDERGAGSRAAGGRRPAGDTPPRLVERRRTANVAETVVW